VRGRGTTGEQGKTHEGRGTGIIDRETATGIAIESEITTNAKRIDMGAGDESARSENSDARYYDTIHMIKPSSSLPFLAAHHHRLPFLGELQK